MADKRRMRPFEQRQHAQRMRPVAAQVWARYHDLRAGGTCGKAPEGCPPSVIAKGLNDAGMGDFPVADLRLAEQFEEGRKDVTVVIPSKNTRAPLQECVRAVAGHALYPTEIIVVDGGSTDGTRAMLAEEELPALRVIERPKSRSFAESCNAGAREASGRYLIFLNSDAIPTAKWDEQLLGALKSDPRAGATGPMSNRVKGKQYDYEARYIGSRDNPRPYEDYAFERLLERGGKFEEVRDLSGLCLAVPADVWDSVGEFDERFHPGNFEDNDWCLRAMLQGWRLYVARGAYVHHLGQGTFNANGINWQGAMEANKRRFLQKWSHEMAVTA